MGRTSAKLVLFVMGTSLGIANRAWAQVASAPCHDDLDSLQARIAQDYGGYRLEVAKTRQAALDDTLASLMRVASSTAGAGCYRVLRALVEWYHDPHLFVYQAPVVDSTRATGHATRPWNEPRAKRYYDAHVGHLDPVEGIWYDGRLRMAVVPAADSARGHFEVVVVEADTIGWSPGDLRGTMRKMANGDYDVVLESPNRSSQQLTGAIYKRVLFRLSPGIWGKSYPIASADVGLLDPENAHRATLLVRGGTVVISIPSHDPTFRSTLDSLLRANDSILRAADRLIVDLRGNEGGSSNVTNGLLPFIETEPRRATLYGSDSAMMLSSPDQIRYATRSFGSDTSAFVRSLVARLRAHTGEFVPLSDASEPESIPTRVPPVYGPKRVAVLTDGGTVSAGEVLVLEALASTRAVVIGEPTAGALDYQSVAIVWFSSTERRWGLGYPTITRNLSLPKNGMRGVGIAPDVRVDWTSIADPIAFVDQLLRR